MKCPNCNGEIKLGEKYCGRCGNPVPDEKSGKDEKKTGKKNAKQNRSSGKKEKSGKNGKKGLFLPLGLGILCVLIIVVVGLVVTPKQTTAGKLQEKMDLGNNYLEKADYVKAKAAFSEALEIDEKSPEAALGMADAYNGQKKPDQALKYLKKASQNVKTASEEKDATHVPKDTADFSSHYEKSCNETADQYKSSNNISKQQETKEVIKEVVKEVLKETNEIDINKVEPNENQPRKEFNEDALQELADSIKQHGLIEPIIVQEGKKGFYQIIAGERRWRAARLAGLKKVPAIVKEYTDQEIMEIALIENIQREDLNPIEEAEAYQRLISEYKLKQDEVADKVSKSRVAITNALRLLKLDERVRRMVVEDKIKSGHARALLSIKDGELQYETALQIFDGNLTVRETEKLVKKLLEEPKPSKKEDVEINKQLQIIYEQYEEKLKNKLGTKVKINQKNNGKGKIEIEYYSADDFDRIIEAITQK